MHWSLLVAGNTEKEIWARPHRAKYQEKNMDGGITEVRREDGPVAVHPGNNTSLCLVRPKETEKQ